MPIELPPPPPLWLPPRPAIVRPAGDLFGRASFVPAMPFYRASVAGATATLTDSETQVSNAATFTFTTKAAGTAVGTSRVVVIVHSWRTVAAASFIINSVNFNGSLADQESFSNSGGTGNVSTIASILSLAVAGTTVTVVVAFSSNMDACRVDVYRLNSLTTSANDDGNFGGGGSNTGSCSLTLNVTSPGVIFAGFTGLYTGGATPGFSNLSGSVDSTYTDGVNNWSLAGHAVGQATQTGRNILASFTNSGTGSLTVASWH